MIAWFSRVFRRCAAPVGAAVQGIADYEDIASVLTRVLSHLSAPDCEVLWSHFDTPAEAADRITFLAERVRERDPSAIADLKILFAPTGDLQEISLSSGWGDEFLELAKRFDLAIGEPI